MKQTLLRLMKDGPNKTDNTFVWIFGNLLWYQTWVFVFLAALPLYVGLLSLNYGSGSLGVFVTYGAFVVLNDKINEYRISNAT